MSSIIPQGFKVKHDTFNIGNQDHYLRGVRRETVLILFNWTERSGIVEKYICLDGVMEAYLFYMQMAVVRFHFEVQKWEC